MSLKNIHIENFRQFRSLKLEKLSGITLIGGKNGAGKTSALEGIYLAATEVSSKKFEEFESRRRQPESILNVSAKDFPAPWAMLFPIGVEAREIKFNYENMEDKSFELIIRQIDDVSELSDHVQSIVRSHDTSPGELKNILICETQCPIGKPHKHSTLMLNHNRVTQQIKVNRDALPSPHSIGAGGVYFVSTQDWSAINELNKLYSNLKKTAGAYEKFIEIMQVMDSNIASIEILEYRSQFQLHVTNQSGSVPISHAGDGALRIALYAATILASENAVVLIDEIENGLHYSLLSELWEALNKACEITGSQLVATTHSAECIRAAAQNVDDERFTYIRLDQLSNSSTHAEYYSNSDAIESLNAGIPIR